MAVMRSPFFPRMDPYLEHPALWPDVHYRLIAALADVLSPMLAPRYYVGLGCRVYRLNPDELKLVGIPDIAVTPSREPQPRPRGALPLADTDVLEVEVPVRVEAREYFLEVHEVGVGELVTSVEMLSPTNKQWGNGRREYEAKRAAVFDSLTNLVEIDLLRAGEPMPVIGKAVRSDYRFLVSRGSQRPRAQQYAFNLRQPIPQFPLPLLPGDVEPLVDLGAILHSLYERARFDLRLDYTRPPVPPLSGPDADWARELLARAA